MKQTTEIPVELLIIDTAPTSPQHVGSIKRLGRIYNPVVYPTSDGKYVVRDGRGRCLESMSLGATSILCDVMPPASETEQRIVSLAANLARRDNPMGEAEDIEALLGKVGPDGKTITQVELAELAGCSQSKISQLLQLTRLIPQIREWVKLGKSNGGIAAKAGYAAAMLDTYTQMELAEGGPFTIDQVKAVKMNALSEMLNMANLDIVMPQIESDTITISSDDLDTIRGGGVVTVTYKGVGLVISKEVDF